MSGTATLRSDCAFTRYTNSSGIAKFACTVTSAGSLTVAAKFPTLSAPAVTVTVAAGERSVASCQQRCHLRPAQQARMYA